MEPPPVSYDTKQIQRRNYTPAEEQTTSLPDLPVYDSAVVEKQYQACLRGIRMEQEYDQLRIRLTNDREEDDLPTKPFYIIRKIGNHGDTIGMAAKRSFLKSMGEYQELSRQIVDSITVDAHYPYPVSYTSCQVRNKRSIPGGHIDVKRQDNRAVVLLTGLTGFDSIVALNRDGIPWATLFSYTLERPRYYYRNIPFYGKAFEKLEQTAATATDAEALPGNPPHPIGAHPANAPGRFYRQASRSISMISSSSPSLLAHVSFSNG